ncbi:hypothetical protein [Nocardiopsis sp. YSL2]|uniref:hypothetical protein n=1 Tax=Nocardiopsis sp. YSL2 TaxID=2939492 RepID=UPI0026F41D13|nr:hypothetical protein [Nocardiopsis sp. YSL2]
MTDLTDALDALAAVPDRRREAEIFERDRIAAARAAGASWERIAKTLGIRTRQGAEQRYNRLVEATADTTSKETTG